MTHEAVTCKMHLLNWGVALCNENRIETRKKNSELTKQKKYTPNQVDQNSLATYVHAMPDELTNTQNPNGAVSCHPDLSNPHRL